MKLVRPLEGPFQAIVDDVLVGMGAPRTHEVAKLAPKLVALSRAYNEGRAEGTKTELPLAARVAFSFPRDVPKGAGAVRELVASGALSLNGGAPLRVLDLGAGVGAMTWGVARALSAAGARGRIEALLVDEDEAALEAASALVAKGARRLAPVELVVRTRAARIGAPQSLPEADLVLVGQVLSELDLREPAETRVARHASLLAGLLDTVAPAGSLVVVEPALRERTRHLHAVRDRVLVERPTTTVFAPCLHAAPCPALASEGDWCHEDLPVDLPEWLVPLARAAGLRYEGLSFSYLVLRKDGDCLARRFGGGSGQLRLRVVSDLMRTKGKIELFGCTEHGERLRLRRLDRDAKRAGELPEMGRGDVIRLEAPSAPVDERGRMAPDVAIDVWRPHG